MNPLKTLSIVGIGAVVIALGTESIFEAPATAARINWSVTESA
jgi:hypothetical protein